MKIKLMVGEPWDFKSSDGDNVLFGETDLQEKGEGKYGEWLIVKCTPFFVDQHFITSLLLTARYAKVRLTDALVSGKEINVNASWHREGLVWNPTLASIAEQNPKIVGGWLIGAVVQVN